MERKIIDLEIVDELDGSGVDAIALVDIPAIEKNFMYFRVEDHKMEIDTSALPTYVNQIGEKKEFGAEEYPTIEEAQERSKELGLNGEIHSHAIEGGFIYMPGASHSDLEKAIAGTGDFASVEELSVGDEVSWKTADQNPRGKITEIVKGSKKVPGVDFEIQGTEEDPGYIIEIYEEVEGQWESTGKYVGRKANSILKNVQLSKIHNYSKLMFADEDKRELVGPVAIPDIEIPRKNEDGSIYFVRFSKEVVRKMAEKFMREQKLSDSNIQHDSEQDALSYVYESWIVENPEDKANSVYGLDVPIGTWMVKMKVTDSNVWAKVKSGEVKGLSLEGAFMSKEDYMSYQKDREIYNRVIRILKSC